MLWAQRRGADVFRRYHDAVFERFWERALDIEDSEAIAAVLYDRARTPGPTLARRERWRRGRGVSAEKPRRGRVRRAHLRCRRAEQYWGREHLPDIRASWSPGLKSEIDPAPARLRPRAACWRSAARSRAHLLCIACGSGTSRRTSPPKLYLAPAGTTNWSANQCANDPGRIGQSGTSASCSRTLWLAATT